MADWNGDGKRDLLAGHGHYSHVSFCRNTNIGSLPMLAAGVARKVGTAALSVGARANPHAHGWDEDGLRDLLCGDANGYVGVFKNIGTRQAPGYTPGIQLQAGGTAINFGIRAAIRALDRDGDGRKDTVGSGSGSSVVLQWRSASYLKYDRLGSDALDATSSVLVSNLDSAGISTSWIRA